MERQWDCKVLGSSSTMQGPKVPSPYTVYTVGCAMAHICSIFCLLVVNKTKVCSQYTVACGMTHIYIIYLSACSEEDHGPCTGVWDSPGPLPRREERSWSFEALVPVAAVAVAAAVAAVCMCVCIVPDTWCW